MTDATEKIIEQIRRDSSMMAELNRRVAVQGTRHRMRLAGRTIDVVVYPAATKNSPMIFAFHGGGFVFGGCALDDRLHQTMSEELAVNVVSVGYRKGEKNPFPRAVNDAYDAVKHFVDDSQGKYDFDRSKIVTFGSSAGANLAVTTSILAHRRKEFKVGMQILNYPFLDMATPPEAKGYESDELTRVRYFNDVYAQPAQRKDPLVSPVLADDGDFDRATRAIVSLADIDPLRAEGELYAERLRSLGMDVAQRVSDGQGHGYLEFAFRESLAGYCPPLIEAAAEDGSLYSERDATVRFIKEHWERWMAG